MTLALASTVRRSVAAVPAPVLAVAAGGLALRALAMAASGSAWLFLNDSHEYLTHARAPALDGYHPLGYPIFLLVTGTSSHLLALTAVQHLIGEATGVLVAVAALRLGAGPWVAAAAAAPQLLDPYVVVLEQMVMAETLATILTTLAIVLLVRSVPSERRPLGGRLVAVALLLAAAVLVRTAASGAILGVGAWLAAGRPSLRRLALPAVAGVVPIAAYAAAVGVTTGHVGLSAHQSRFLYARMAPYADCARLDLTGPAATLCDPRPVRDRPQPDYYLWHPDAPLKQLPVLVRDVAAAQAGDAMIKAQPGTWVATTLHSMWEFSLWAPWHTAVGPKQADPSILVADDRHTTVRPRQDPRASSGVRTVQHVRRVPMAILHGYQRYVTTPVPLYAAALLLGLLRPALRGRRAAVAVPALAALGMLVVPAATSEWDLRYLLPTLPLIGLAAGAAWTRAGRWTLPRTVSA